VNPISLLETILHALAGFVTDTIDQFGVAAVFVLMAVESACIPVPSEVIQLYAGFMVSEDRMSFTVAVLAGTVGNVVGSWVAWAVGVYGGRPFIERHGKWLHISERNMAWADRWFDRYGPKVVFFSRMLPIIRTFISLPAGIARMPFWKFTVYTFFGALPWCFALTLAGVQVGENWEDLEGQLKYFTYLVAATIVVGAVYLAVRLWRNRVPPTGTAGIDA
jgi:membrane protein DedA with SNARE-associated domain